MKKCIKCNREVKWIGKNNFCRSCAVIGFRHSEDAKKKMSKAKKGIRPWNYGMKFPKKEHGWKEMLPNCITCEKRLSAKNLKTGYCNMCIPRKGENCSNWQGGKTLHPKYFSFMEKRRQLKKLTNGGSHSLGEWDKLKQQYNNMCLCCKQFEPEIKLTEDHIIPIFLGGSDDISNIQPLCNSCNSRKHLKVVNYIESLTSTIIND